MKDYLRRGLAMLMSIIMTLSLFVDCLPMEAYAEETLSSNSIQPRAASVPNINFGIDVTKITEPEGRSDELTYIGDSRQLSINKYARRDNNWWLDYDSTTTTWSIDDAGAKYATVDGSGKVTAKIFEPRDISAHDIVITAKTTFYKNGRPVGTGTETKKLQVQFSESKVYCYTRVPGVTSGTPTQMWYTLNKSENDTALIWGAPKPTKSRWGTLSRGQYVLVQGPSNLPELTLNGKTYSYGGENGYSLTSSEVVCSDGANEGANGGPVVNSGTATYHLNYELSYPRQDEDDQILVTFRVQQPGGTEFNPDVDKQQLKEKGKDGVSDINFDPPQDRTKQHEGLTYTFDGWYTDESCGQYVDTKSTEKLYEDKTYYGKYVTNEGKLRVEYYYDNVLSENIYENKFKVGSLKQSLDTLKGYNYRDGFTFASSDPVADADGNISVTIEAGKTTTIRIDYVSNYSVSYVITNPPAGVTRTTVKNYVENEQVTVESAPEVKDCTFVGWKLTSGNLKQGKDMYAPGDKFTMPGSAVRFEGEYVKNTFTVTYMVDGERYGNVDTENVGDSVTLRTAPIKEGYTFSGWTTGDAMIENGKFTMPDKNVTLVGSFTASTNTAYKVEHYKQNVDGSYPETASETEDKTGTTGANVTATAKSYTGFHLSTIPNKNDGMTGTIAADGSTVLKVYYDRDEYTVKYEFSDNPGNLNAPGPVKVRYGGSVEVDKTNVSVEGYAFDGWKQGNTVVTEIENITTDVTLHGTYTPILYTVYFIDGSVTKPIHIDFPAINAGPKVNDTVYCLTADGKPGYTFNGWSTKDLSDDGSETTYAAGESFTMPPHDVTLTAQYAINSYDVKYVDEDGTTPLTGDEYKTAAYNYQATVTVAAGPKKVGYTFTGWQMTEGGTGIYSTDDAATDNNSFMMPAGDVTLKATYTPNTNTAYTVEHYQQNIDGNGYTKVESDTQNLRGTTGAPATVTPKTYTGFTYSKTEPANATISGDGNTVVKVYYDRNMVNVSYRLTSNENPVSPTAPATKAYRYGATVEVEAPLTANGYNFAGWNAPMGLTVDDVNGKKTFTVPETAVEFTGAFTLNEFTVMYIADGKTVDTKTCSYNELVTVIAKVDKEGYTFTGWLMTAGGTGTYNADDDNNANESFTMPPHDVTLTAQYAINSYEVKYVDENGTTPLTGDDYKTASYNYQATVTVAAGPMKAGYSFDGWMRSDTNQKSGATFNMPASNVTLKATYTPNTNTAYKVEHYKQNVDSNGYILADTQNLTGTTGATVNATAKTYAGFTFDENVTGTVKSGMIAGDGSLVLKLYYTRNTNTAYTIEYYQQNVNDDGYTKVEGDTQNLKGTTGATATVTPEADKYIGFHVSNDDELNVLSATIAGNGTTTLKVYYDREVYTVTYSFTNNPGGKTEPPNQTARYGADVPVSSDMYTDVQGYTFSGWKLGGNVVTSIPGITGDVTLTGEFMANEYNYTVNYLLRGTDEAVPGSTSETKKAAFASVVTENAPEIAGFKPVSPSETIPSISSDEKQNVINLCYYKEVTVKADDASKTYGELDPTFTATVDGLLAEDQNDLIRYSFTRENAGVNDVGTYDITPGNAKGLKPYYEVTKYIPGTLTITPLAVTITAANYSKEYDGGDYTWTATIEGALADDNVGVEYQVDGGNWTTNAPTVKDVVFHTVNVRLTNADDYQAANANTEYTLEVTKRPITIQPHNESKPYDGTALTASQYDITSGTLATGDALSDVTYEGSITEFGTAQSSITGYKIFKGTEDVSGNYEVTPATGTLEITAREVTIIAAGYDEMYDGAAHGGTVTTKVGTADVDVALVYSTNGTDWSDTAPTVTDYTARPVMVYVKLKDTKNNQLPNGATEVTYTLNVQKRNVTLTSATPEAKVYDAKALTDGTVTVSGDGFATGEGATYQVRGTQTNTGESPNHFTYTLSAGTKAENYAITTVEGKLVVNKRDLTLDGNEVTVTYNGTKHSVSGIKDEPTGLLSGHKVTGVSFDIAGTDAGTYEQGAYTGAAVIKDADGNVVTENYNILTGEPAKLTIDPITIKIRPKAVTKTYDGTPLTTTEFEYVEGSGRLLDGDTLIVEIDGSVTDVGSGVSTITSYRVVEQSARALNENGNYAIQTESGTLTVTQRALTLKGRDGDAVYNGQTQTFNAFDAEGLVSGHRIDGLSYKAEGKNAKSYTGTFDGTLRILDTNGKDVTGNYATPTTQPGTLTISRAKLRITADSASKPFDGAPLRAGGVTIELTDSDSKQSLDTKGQLSKVSLLGGDECWIGTEDEQTYVGKGTNTVRIQWTYETRANYELENRPGYLTVTDGDRIVVTTTGGIFAYDGQPHGATVTVDNLPAGYTVERAESSATAQTVLDGTVEATADRLVIRDSNGDDVTDQLPITYTDGRIIINPTPLYITTQSAAKEYDGEPLYAGVTVTGLVNNETVSVTAMGSQTEVGSSPNGYHIAWVGTAKVYNYEIVETLGTLTVTAVGEAAVPQPQNEEDDAPDVRVVDTLLLEDEIVPLAGTAESCCILHFLLALAALATVLISGHDTKKLQEKITELKKKESPEDGEDDGRRDGRKDDN